MAFFLHCDAQHMYTALPLRKLNLVPFLFSFVAPCCSTSHDTDDVQYHTFLDTKHPPRWTSLIGSHESVSVVCKAARKARGWAKLSNGGFCCAHPETPGRSGTSKTGVSGQVHLGYISSVPERPCVLFRLSLEGRGVPGCVCSLRWKASPTRGPFASPCTQPTCGSQSIPPTFVYVRCLGGH